MATLSPQQQTFARALLHHTQADAYRIAFNPSDDVLQESIESQACRLAAKPHIKQFIKETLDAARITDLESVGHAFKELCDDLAGAREAKNWTACAAFQRIKLQVLGMLKDTVSVSMEQTITDDELIRRITGQQPALAALLKTQLGRDDQYASQ